MSAYRVSLTIDLNIIIDSAKDDGQAESIAVSACEDALNRLPHAVEIESTDVADIQEEEL